MHRARYLFGVLTLVATIVGTFWIVRLLQQLDERPGVLVRVEFHDARGLRAGADVRYRGVRAGIVRDVDITDDGGKASVSVLLDPQAARHACINSVFWIVTPRFAGLTTGATGLDTLVRDSYLAFQTPAAAGSTLAVGSLVSGSERPPAVSEDAALDEVQHGDLLMQVLLPENHGLRAGSAVTFRGMKTGEVRRVELAAEGSHVRATLRILRAHRQTVTDKTVFWVARPQLSGALFSGFRVNDVGALLTPFVSYYGAPGEGVPVDDGFLAVAQADRPDFEVAAVPAEALRLARPNGFFTVDGLVVVRVVYAATEKDTFSADDPVHNEGTGLLFLDRSGRPVVITARSAVDGSFTESDLFGGAAEIADEQIKVMLPSGAVLHAGRVWVHPEGADIAALVLTDHTTDQADNLPLTKASNLHFGDSVELAPPFALQCAGADGANLPAIEMVDGEVIELAGHLGAAVTAGGKVFGIYGRTIGDAGVPIVVPLQLVPTDLRPQ
ncbi:MAG: MCE family protein [Planctomycetes bacterium]|nr:MCE family protein [Planctomycetota bacterium]